MRDERRRESCPSWYDPLRPLSDVPKGKQLENSERQETGDSKGQPECDVPQPIASKTGEEILEAYAVELTPENQQRDRYQPDTKKDRGDRSPRMRCAG